MLLLACSFLHKIMNLSKAAMKALTENQEDVTVAQVMAQADGAKIAKLLKGEKDESLNGRPQKQSAGVMMIWLVFKMYSVLSTNEQVGVR